MTTPILGLTELANNQRHQFATANRAFRDLEAAANDVAAVDLSGGNATLTGAAFNAAFLFRANGHTVDRELTVPQQKRFFAIRNAGTGVVSVVRGSTSLPVGEGSAGIFYADGTADGLVAIASGGGGGSATGSYATADISSGVLDLSGVEVDVVRVPVDEVIDTITLPSADTNTYRELFILFEQDATGYSVSGWTGVSWAGGAAPTIDDSADAVTAVALLVFGDGTVYGE